MFRRICLGFLALDGQSVIVDGERCPSVEPALSGQRTVGYAAMSALQASRQVDRSGSTDGPVSAAPVPKTTVSDPLGFSKADLGAAEANWRFVPHCCRPTPENRRTLHQ